MSASITQKKEATNLIGAGVRFPVQLQAQMASNPIIRSFDAKVNRNISDATQSQQFKRWFGDWQNHPESASKVVNEDGTPRVMYHGTNSKDFYVFDSSRSDKRVKLNTLGDGYYFTGEEETAKRYGERVMALYLDIKKPYRVYARDGGIRAQMADDFHMDADSISRNDIQSILRANGYDGVLLYRSKYDADSDFSTAVAFSNTQIKSATDNIGTFDGTNPDIRYSKRVTDKDTVKFLEGSEEIHEFDRSKNRLSQNIRELAEMSSVYSVSENKLSKTGKRPTDIFAEYFDSWGNSLFSEELGTVSVKKSSIKSEIRHGVTAEKLASVEAIPTVLKEGKVIFAEYKPGSDVQRIVVCAPIRIGTVPYYMGVMLQRDTQNQRLYLHNVAVEKEASAVSQADLLTTGADENGERLFITSILQNALAVKYGLANDSHSVGDISGDLGESALFSKRGTSNRALLVNALDSAVSSDIEQERLTQYRKSIDMLDAEQKKLAGLRAEIRALSCLCKNAVRVPPQ